MWYGGLLGTGFEVGALVVLSIAVLAGFLSAFFTVYMIFRKTEEHTPSAIWFSLIAGVVLSGFVGIIPFLGIVSGIEELRSYARNPYITAFDVIKVILTMLVYILILVVLPAISIRNLLTSRSPYKKVEKIMARIGIVLALLIVLAWVAFSK